MRGYPYLEAFTSAGVDRHSLLGGTVDGSEISSPTEPTRYAGYEKTLPLVFHFLIIFIYLLFLWSTRSAFSFILRLVLLYLSYLIFFCDSSTRIWVMASLTWLRDHTHWTHHSSGRVISSKQLSYIIKIHKSNDQDKYLHGAESFPKR